MYLASIHLRTQQGIYYLRARLKSNAADCVMVALSPSEEGQGDAVDSMGAGLEIKCAMRQIAIK